MEVQHCKNLAEHTIILTSQFRGRLDVARERAYTRQRLLHDELANLSPSTGSSWVTPKRKACHDDELSPSLRQTRHRLTVLSPDISESDTQVRPLSWDGFMPREPHTPSTNTTMLHLSDSPESPRHFQSNAAQQSLIVEACTKSWPTDFYVFEIVKGFEEIERCSRLKGSNIKKAFEAHFSLPYARSTFYEHKGRWTSSSPDAKASALAAGATPSGLWKCFMVDNPAPRAATKAARRRRAMDQMVDSDEGDGDDGDGD
jgi:hypothetical protein